MIQVGPKQQLYPTDRDCSPTAPESAPAPAGLHSPLKCPELDLSLPLSTESQGCDTAVAKSECTQRQKQVSFDMRAGVAKEPEVVKVLAEPCIHFGTKPFKSSVKDKSTPGMQTVPGQTRGVPLHQWGEMNTSLGIRAQLDGLAGAKFDSNKAVHDQLQRSTHIKNIINARATEGVNIPRSQHLYRGLVSISFEDDQLISQTLRDRFQLVLPTSSHDSEKSVLEAPDLLAFFSAELLRENPLLPGGELKEPRPRPEPRPSQATFDLYCRHHRWEA